jgi:hypothetical protein
MLLLFLCSTIHLAAFLLPVAAYNSRVEQLQVRKFAAMLSELTKSETLSLVQFEFLLRASDRPFAAPCNLVRLDSAARQEVSDEHSGEGGTAAFCFAFCARPRPLLSWLQLTSV